METVRPAAITTSSTSSASSTARSGLLRSVTNKLSRGGRKQGTPKGSADSKGDTNITTTKSSQHHHKHRHEYLDDYTVPVFDDRPDEKDKALLKAKQLQHLQRHLLVAARKDAGGHGSAAKDTEEAVLASIFASVSAIKAAYAQIQVAQQPYDAEMIQAADLTVVDELRRISHIKHGYLNRSKQQSLVLPDHQEEGGKGTTSQTVEEEVREKKNLVKTYEITAAKLQAEVKAKDEELESLTQVLREVENKNRALEHRLRYPRHSRSTHSPSGSPAAAANAVSALQGLHLSGLDPTHFLLALRYAVASVRDFVGVLVQQMESAGWDLTRAAEAIAPSATAPEARDLAFQSYVCMGMFSDFHLGPGFRAPDDDKASTTPVDRRRQCFEEFTADLACDSAKDLARLRRPFAEFCRAKYAAIVRPQMESAFFAGMDRRAMADAQLFVAFAEMARRVWLLHWLFFSFDPDAAGGAYMFRAPPGARYSEVYMDSVGPAQSPAVVGFTVVPGFRIRKTVIQCKVFLTPATSASTDHGR